MGFHRQPERHVIDHAKGTPVARLVACTEIVRITREADPFGLADPCPDNQFGPHAAISSCGDVVCVYCAKVFWS